MGEFAVIYFLSLLVCSIPIIVFVVDYLISSRADKSWLPIAILILVGGFVPVVGTVYAFIILFLGCLLLGCLLVYGDVSDD